MGRKKKVVNNMRIGNGYDVHRLVPDRKLILGGVEIPYEKGLLGHSDADVLVHAVMDALLGAAALGDIGKHFPDHDPAYAGADSLVLLKKVGDMLSDRAWYIENIDATIIAQKPKLAPYIQDMTANIASVLGISVNQVNVKATTEEGLGFTGQGLGIAASAVCLLSEIQNYIGIDVMKDDYMTGTGKQNPGDRTCTSCCGLGCPFRDSSDDAESHEAHSLHSSVHQADFLERGQDDTMG